MTQEQIEDLKRFKEDLYKILWKVNELSITYQEEDKGKILSRVESLLFKLRNEIHFIQRNLELSKENEA